MALVMLTNHASENPPKTRMNKGFSGFLRRFPIVANKLHE